MGDTFGQPPCTPGQGTSKARTSAAAIMGGVRDGEPEVQRPELLAALLVLGRLNGPAAAEVPLTAAWWIVEGYDSVELTRLAGLSGEDTFEVRDALRAALDDMAVERPSMTAALTVVFEDLARRCLAGRISERSVVGEVERVYIDSDYSDSVADQPLGATYGFDDEWGAGWGRTEAELAADVRSACQQQLRS